MRIQDFVNSVRAIFRHKDSELPDEIIRGLIRSLEEEDAETAEEGCSCEDVFQLVDQYAEVKVRGEDAARLMPLIKKHMDGCHDCCEEYEALLDILEHTKNEE